MNLIQSLVDSIFQLILFSFIPFIWWFIFWRKKEKFLPWIGIKKPVVKNKRLVILLCCLFLAVSVLSTVFFGGVVETSETAAGQFQGLGIIALFPALLFGMIQTGAAEEILFRGFLAKRFIKQFGFTFGNILQAFLFGLLHIGLFYAVTTINIFQAALIFSIPFLTSLFFVYINEKESGGSIIPSWLMHGIGNVLVSIIVMFNLNI